MTDDGAPLFLGPLFAGTDSEVPLFHPPVKRSVTIAGHQTSITLEPLFWEALHAEAEARDLPLNALIAQIDVARLEADEPPGLAGAIRLWLFSQKSA